MASGKKNGARKQPKAPALRPDIASLPKYVPGARGDGRQLWKLSSNE